MLQLLQRAYGLRLLARHLLGELGLLRGSHEYGKLYRWIIYDRAPPSLPRYWPNGTLDSVFRERDVLNVSGVRHVQAQ